MPAPTLDLAPVRSAIVALMQSVAGMGTVHDRERFADKRSALAAMYVNSAQTGQRLYGWFVSRFRTREFYIDINRWVADVDWRLVGYMSLDDGDSTELKLNAQVELVRDKFRDSDDLGLGASVTQILPERGNERGVQVEDIDHVMFADVLCHRARCRVATRIYF